ncbi:MAG: VOC family protein [candidate division WOR-3 bacterium]
MKKEFSCDHIGLFTNNADRLINFYKKILKFKLISSERLQTNVVKALFKIKSTACFYRLKSEDLLLEIFVPHSKKKTGKSIIRYGIHHFGMIVKNREEYIKNLRQKKVKIITLKRNGHKVYFIEDPDGNLIEIREAK